MKKIRHETFKWEDVIYCPACDKIMNNSPEFMQNSEILYWKCENCGCPFYTNTKATQTKKRATKIGLALGVFFVLFVGVILLGSC